MDALAANRQRYVDPVVDEEGDIVSLGDAVQLSRDPYKLAGIAGLVSVLDAGHAALQRCLDDIADVSPSEDFRPRVGDEIQRVVNVLFPHDEKSSFDLDLLCSVEASGFAVYVEWR